MPLPAAVLALWLFRGAVATAAAASLYKAYKAQQRDYDEAYAYYERRTFEYHPGYDPHYYYRREPDFEHRGRSLRRDDFSNYMVEDDYDYRPRDYQRRRLQ